METQNAASVAVTIATETKRAVVLYVRPWIPIDPCEKIEEDAGVLAKELREEVVRRGWIVLGEYTDEIYTYTVATAEAINPGYDAMLKRCEAGGVDAVATVHLDCIAISLTRLVDVVAPLEALGVSLVSTRQEFDTGDLQTHRITDIFLGYISKWRARDLARKAEAEATPELEKTRLGDISSLNFCNQATADIIAPWLGRKGTVQELQELLGVKSRATVTLALVAYRKFKERTEKATLAAAEGETDAVDSGPAPQSRNSDPVGVTRLVGGRKIYCFHSLEKLTITQDWYWKGTVPYRTLGKLLGCGHWDVVRAVKGYEALEARAKANKVTEIEQYTKEMGAVQPPPEKRGRGRPRKNPRLDKMGLEPAAPLTPAPRQEIVGRPKKYDFSSPDLLAIISQWNASKSKPNEGGFRKLQRLLGLSTSPTYRAIKEFEELTRRAQANQVTVFVQAARERGETPSEPAPAAKPEAPSEETETLTID